MNKENHHFKHYLWNQNAVVLLTSSFLHGELSPAKTKLQLRARKENLNRFSPYTLFPFFIST